MTGPYPDIRIERDGPIAEVVLARSHKLNALTLSMFQQVRRAFEELDADDSVRGVILRGEGRMFTAGLDLIAAVSMLQFNEEGDSPATKSRKLYELIKDLQSTTGAIAACRHPVIAAVHGKCIGGGVDFITACDMRVCSAEATFSVFETRLAIVADVGTLQRLNGIVGKGIAREMAFTGADMGADRALSVGLVNAVHPDPDAMLAGARALAAEIARNSPVAVRGTKRVMDYSDQHGVAAGLEFVAQWNTAFLHSHDLAEALGAFLEKRPGVFKGN